MLFVKKGDNTPKKLYKRHTSLVIERCMPLCRIFIKTTFKIKIINQLVYKLINIK